MLEELKEAVCLANRRLYREGLVRLTWGNVSAVDRDAGRVVIKPSGIPFADLTPNDMVVVSLQTGEVVEGGCRPSVDTPTHRVLYQAFEAIGGVAHSHSLYATAWAQSQRGIMPLGTTHADYFHGIIPCTRQPSHEDMAGDYEAGTGRIIVELFSTLRIAPLTMPAVLVASHGSFTWGTTAAEAVEHAYLLEYLAKLASETLQIEPYPRPLPQELLDKHWLRKHGDDAYYGQR